MSERWRRVAGAVAAAGVALLAGCRAAPAQTTSTWRSVDTDHGTRLEILARGEVDFTDDDRDVARISSDGRLTIEEAVRGRPERRVEFRPDERGGVRRLYFEDGVQRAPDADDRAWIERMILQAVRSSGVGAERRVARIRARQGVDGVLREIEQIEGDGGKRHYYVTLLRSSPALRDDETVRVFRHLAREIDSDGEKRYTLAQALERTRLGPAEVAALLDAAGTIGSDGEKRYVLAQVLERASPGPAELAALLGVAATIRSDGERAYVLARVARDNPLADARVRQAFFRAAGGISSDGELARVLVTVLRREGARDDVVAAAIRASEEISSDGERARVLVSVPQRSLRSEGVRAAFERAMDGIGSDGERARVARWLATVAT
ncbi:MAG TPA: hypothetical protein VF746_31890 [Longimicrobium sp.]